MGCGNDGCRGGGGRGSGIDRSPAEGKNQRRERGRGSRWKVWGWELMVVTAVAGR